ncbi:putative Histidine kinase [Nitrospira tepida]|uniref:histidine kinase n=1 Tax=Nitrospira tepida TaxID=2973512 RepID=A0AA86T5D3_9BACT|nr:hybrid sensor histidine kinase/response regulator [Nitrospira tepida]CAI4030667.1 putative Histidine kinase [Nitrospira tepida]
MSVSSLFSRISIRAKLLTALLVLALVPLIVVGIIVYETSQDILKQNASEKLEELAAQTMGKIDRVLFASTQDLQAWASMEAMQDVAADDPRGRITLSLLRLWSQYGHYSSIYCVNAQGTIVSSSEVSLIGHVVSNEPWFRAAMQSATVTTTDLADDPLTKSISLRIMTPITRPNGGRKPIGYLVAHLPQSELQEITAQVKVQGESGERQGSVLLANVAGGVLAGPPSLLSRSETRSFPAATLSQLGYRLPESSRARDRGSFLADHDELLIGFAKSTGFRTFEGLGWTILVAQDREDAFGQVKTLRRVFLGLLVITTLLVLAVAYLLSRHISIPIQSLTHLADRIAAGDLSQTIGVMGTDEVGTLARSFNRMTEDLRRSRDELVRANEAMESARDRALEVSRLKSQFVANMSHEIRTPMNGVLGMTELLLTTALTDRQRHFVDTIHRSATALLHTINDILDFSKIEAGKLELETVSFDVGETVEDVVELVAERAQRKGLELLCSIPRTVPSTLEGDPGRLRQILINLLGNAIKFTERGEVGLSVSVLEDHSSTVKLRVEITDTGIGISPEAQRQIFEPFCQADNSSTRKYGGTGLGLSIAKQLVELMQGEIGVESTEGRGTTFWFTSRFAKPETREPASAFDQSELPDLTGRRILVVDDNRSNREILQDRIAEWNLSPSGASTGEEAFAVLKEAAQSGRPFHVALLDHPMPESDGVELARRIKADPELAGTGLILLASVTGLGDHQPVMETGVEAVLVKPVRRSLLIRALLNLLRRPGADGPDSRRTAGAPVSEAGTSPPSETFPLKVLVAEDNSVNQEVARLMLEDLGCSVEIVQNGVEALEAATRSRHDLIFMDCQMPDMDGFAATRAIRLREDSQRSMVNRQSSEKAGPTGPSSPMTHDRSPMTPPRVPIIALTAHAIQGDRERCLAAGMDDYLAKPFTRRQLAEVMRRWHRPQITAAAGASESEAAVIQEPLTEAAPPASAAPASPAAEEPPVVQEEAAIDQKVWKDILALQRPGRPDVLVSMLSMFLTDSDQIVEQLRAAVQGNTADRLFSLAHGFKSRCGVLGAFKLAALSKDLEQCGRTKQLSEAAAIFSCFEREYQAVKSSFRIEIDRRRAA